MEESKSSKSFKTPAVLSQLKQENESLRSELRSLSSNLDQVLAKQAKKPTNSGDGNCHAVRAEEVKIARAQVQHWEKEVATLRKTLESSSAQRVQELEAEIAALAGQIKEKENSIRQLGRLQKERGDNLEAIEDGFKITKEIQSLTETLKIRKSKLEKVESLLVKGEESCKQSRERVLELEKKISGLQSAEGGGDDAEPSKIPVVKVDLETIQAKVSQLEKAREAEMAKWRKRLADAEASVKAAVEARDHSSTEFQNKEQLSRILDSKVKELKRSVHFLQRRNETLAKATAPDLSIDPEAVANSGPPKEEVKSLRKSGEVYSSKPNLGY